jgi:hypothetical protein
MNPRASSRALAMIAALAVAACADRDLTSPSRAASGPRAAASADGSADVVRLLRRTDRLPESLSATGVIRPEGGHLQIGRAGLRVDFAAGAVSRPTRITVTAVGGRVVAYRFAPHGLVFSAPVTIRQSLRGTEAWKDPELAAQLQGSYFDRLRVDASESFAGTLERRPGRLRDAGRLLEFTIEHFSGYMVSTGKTSVNVELEVEINSH